MLGSEKRWFKERVEIVRGDEVSQHQSFGAKRLYEEQEREVEVTKAQIRRAGSDGFFRSYGGQANCSMVRGDEFASVRIFGAKSFRDSLEVQHDAVKKEQDKGTGQKNTAVNKHKQ